MHSRMAVLTFDWRRAFAVNNTSVSLLRVVHRGQSQLAPIPLAGAFHCGGHSCNTRVRCRIVSRIRGRCGGKRRSVAVHGAEQVSRLGRGSPPDPVQGRRKAALAGKGVEGSGGCGIPPLSEEGFDRRSGEVSHQIAQWRTSIAPPRAIGTIGGDMASMSQAPTLILTAPDTTAPRIAMVVRTTAAQRERRRALSAA